MEPQTPMVNTAPIFKKPRQAPAPDLIPSSSPAFGTPVYPIRTSRPVEQSRPTVLAINLPPTALRPLAFRSFTKKHNLTLTSGALQLLATFVGKHCGSRWREEGLAEKVLDAAAKSWKKNGGGLIVTDEGDDFAKVLRQIEGSMSGGRISETSTLSRQSSFAFGEADPPSDPGALTNGYITLNRQDSLGLSGLAVNDDQEIRLEPRKWVKVINACEQPRVKYKTVNKHFEPIANRPSLMPSASHKTDLFRDRYNLIHQTLLRNESFQTSSVLAVRTNSLQRTASSLTSNQAYKITPIGNLLGRSGSSHILLGLLTVSPTGLLTLADLTGSIGLDITHARPAPEDGAWFSPGMMALVDGMYEEEGATLQGLDRNTGIGGSIGGKFTVFSIGGPPCERRDVTLGIKASGDNGAHIAGGGFGWVDFLGVGSERATGTTMRQLERKAFHVADPEDISSSGSRIIMLGEVNLDNAHVLKALRAVLLRYDAQVDEQPPMVFVLFGNFARNAAMSGGKRSGSMEYKEHFDALALLIADFPDLLSKATFVFVPGDNDPWASAFSAGGSTVIPRDPVPTMFTNRIRRAFTTANSEAEKSMGTKGTGDVVWASNPARISLFGPTHEIVLFRDNMTGRLRRNAVRFPALRQNGDSKEAAEDSEQHVEDGNVTDGGRAAQAPESPELDIVDVEVDAAVENAESEMPTVKASGRPRTAVSVETLAARKLVKTILDQATLSPFPLSVRPVLWDYATALQLYPLPTALVLMDAETAPFTVSYQGCLVMNPGPLAPAHSKHVIQWIEYDVRTRQGMVKDAHI